MSIKIRHIFILVFVVCLLCILLCSGALADDTDTDGVAYTETPIYIDGMLTCRGYSINGTTYMSLDSLCSILGYEVTTDYDPSAKLLTVELAGIVISVGDNDEYMIANGRYLYLPSGYFRVNGSPVFPLDVVAKLFTLNISYDTTENVYDLDTENETVLMSGDEFYNEEDLYWLSHIITWESGNQPVEGQIAVGNVVLNRVASPRFPDTVKSVILQPGQFSPVENGVIYGEPYNISVICAKLTLEGYNTVGDALFFQVGRYGAVANIATYLCTIADHNFFI